MTSTLIGRWRLVRTDGPANFEHVTMEFHSDGTLQYSIELPDRTQTMNLTYSVSDDVIISKQSSSPKEERRRVSLWWPMGHLGSITTEPVYGSRGLSRRAA